MQKSKFKIVIRRLETEDYQMSLDSNSITEALDEARRLVSARNKTSNNGTFHLHSIETEK
jgi:hypothetical protein